jgi:uncharacterized protein
MPRPSRLRKIRNPPIISGLKPYGRKNTLTEPDVIFLQIEEYEALRLCDYKMLTHFQASDMMNVSRPTLTRIYSRARQKIAEALVLGKQIIIEGGKIYFDSEWYTCNTCGCYFNNPVKLEEIKECPLCKSNNFTIFEQSDIENEESMIRGNDVCICPNCDFEKPHRSGHPCKDETCPKCQQNMMRKGSPHGRNF